MTYTTEGLQKVVDLGEWWDESTGGLPLPLGGNVIRRDLGPEMIREVLALLHDSIAYGRRTARRLDYALKYGRGLDRATGRSLRRHVRERPDARLRRARPGGGRRLMDEAFASRLIPAKVNVEWAS